MLYDSKKIVLMDVREFDNIRPYDDAQTAEALKRIAKAPEIKQVCEFLHGSGLKEDSLRELLCSLNGIDEFQVKVMASVVRAIISKTTKGIETSGIENIKNGKKHILISNHRDIMLDPAIIQLILFENGVSTTEIAVGDNLIANQFIEDAFRSNRMIKVTRGGTPREKYTASKQLSAYLRSCVVSDRCSVWIAQRNGRSKDGKDMTEQGVLKMFEMSGEGDFVNNFDALSILPVSISYQFEPCDFLKARELYITRAVGQYIKSPGEDTQSILIGLMQDKGHVSFDFSPEISREEITQCAKLDKNERFLALAEAIDKRINSNYKLWDNNYISYDLLNGTDKHSDKYTPEAKGYFITYMEKGLSTIVEREPNIDYNKLKEIFLSIYANPVSCR